MVVSHIRDRVLTSFSDLQFDEAKHIYRLDGAIIPSVSRKVEGHVEKVDFDAILPFSAKKKSREEKRIITPQELGASWKKKKDDACKLGHDTHSFLEHYTGVQTPRTKCEEAGVKFFHDMSAQYDVLFREIRMYSRRYWFAGTEDLTLINKETGKIITADYKTNEDLFKNYKGKTLLPPFDWAEECPFNKYQLQLSYYQIMLEDVGLDIEERWLVYLERDGNYKIYRLNNFTEELREHLSNKVTMQ